MSKTKKNGLRKIRQAIKNGNFVSFNYRSKGRFTSHNDMFDPLKITKDFLYYQEWFVAGGPYFTLPLTQIVWSTLKIH